MLTRCPRCSTTFRVTPDQLKARHGRVRCGHCNDVFNALDTLIEAAPQQLPVRVEPVPTTEQAAADDSLSPQTTGNAPPIGALLPTAVEDPGIQAREGLGPEAASSESVEAIETLGAAAPEPATEPAEAVTATAPALEPLLHEPPRKRAWPWALGSVVAMLTLPMQAAIHYRTEISVLYPAAKPMLNSVCAPLGCEVSLPHKPELVGIETSSLAPESGNKLTLSATLKNRAPFAQQYPDLELTLTDTTDKVLVRRILAPAEYLPPKTDADAGFTAGGEIAINLSVDAPGLPAAGYQLYLFYP